MREGSQTVSVQGHSLLPISQPEPDLPFDFAPCKAVSHPCPNKQQRLPVQIQGFVSAMGVSRGHWEQPGQHHSQGGWHLHGMDFSWPSSLSPLVSQPKDWATFWVGMGLKGYRTVRLIFKGKLKISYKLNSRTLSPIWTLRETFPGVFYEFLLTTNGSILQHSLSGTHSTGHHCSVMILGSICCDRAVAFQPCQLDHFWGDFIEFLDEKNEIWEDWL